MNAHTPIPSATQTDPSTDRLPTHAQTLAEQLDAEIEAMGERHRRHLAEMAEIGMEMARLAQKRMVEQDAAIAAGDAAGAALRGDPVMGFNRITRVVRLSMSMEASMLEARRKRLLGLEDERAAKAVAGADARTTAEQARVDVRGYMLGGLVEDTVKQDIRRRQVADPDHDREDLNEAWDEDDEEFDDDESELIEEAFCAALQLLKRGRTYAGYADRPISAVVSQLCDDLGLTPDWSQWAKDNWALDEAEQRIEGSPYVAPATGPP